MPAAGAGWFSPPSPGDIVWRRFPQRELSGPGPKSRPALVLRVGETQANPVLDVAYGTGRKVDELYTGEFAIYPSDGPAYEAAGLSYPTKFDLRRTFELDFNGVWFAIPPGAPCGQTPKLGILHPSLVRRARAARDAVTRVKRRE